MAQFLSACFCGGQHPLRKEGVIPSNPLHRLSVIGRFEPQKNKIVTPKAPRRDAAWLSWH